MCYALRKPKFGTGVPVKGRREYVHVRVYDNIHAVKAFAEHPGASSDTAEF